MRQLNPSTKISAVLCSLFSVFFIISCGGPPATPELLGPPPSKFREIILSKNIRVKDFRKIYTALKDHGRFESLAKFFDGYTDLELEKISAFFSEHFYENNYSPEGFVSLLRSRGDQKFFTSLLKSLSQDTSPALRTSLSKLMVASFYHPLFPDLLKRDALLLDPQWREWFDILEQNKGEFDAEVEDEEPINSFSISNTLEETSQWFGKPENRKELENYLGKIPSAAYIESFFKTLEFFRLQTKKPQAYFKSITQSTASMLGKKSEIQIRDPEDNQFSALLDWAAVAAEPSEGLFTTLESKLKSNEGILSQLAGLFTPLFSEVLAYDFQKYLFERVTLPDGVDVLKGLLDDNNLKSIEELYKIALRSFKFSKVSTINETDQWETDPRVHLHSYVWAKWVQHVLKNNVWGLGGLLKKDADLAAEIAKLRLTYNEFNLDLIQIEADGTLSLIKEQKEILTKISGSETEWIEVLEATLKNKALVKRFGTLNYSIPPQRNVTVSYAIYYAAERLVSIRSMAQPDLAFVILRKLLKTDKDDKTFFSQLETDSILDSVLRLIRGMDSSQWESLKTLLFDQLQLGSDDSQLTQVLLEIFSDTPKLQKKVEKLSQGIQLIRAWDVAAEGLPSSFYFYHRLLQEVPESNLRMFSETFKFLAKTRWFSGTPRQYKYPGWVSMFLYPNNTSKFLWKLSWMPEHLFPLVRESLKESLGQKRNEPYGIIQHLDFFHDIYKKEKGAITLAIDTINGGNFPISISFSDAEILWFAKTFRSENFKVFWKTLFGKNPQWKFKSFVQELIQMQKSGEILNAVRLLKQIQNERFQLLLEGIESLEKNNELHALLESLSLVALE